jgi:hypothetical protein
MAENTTFEYQLARTVVRIAGTISIDTTKSGAREATRTNTVTLDVEADYPSGPQRLVVPNDWWHDRKLSLSWAADGRLSGASHEATGVGGKLLGAGLTIATTALKLAALALVDVPAVVRESVSVDAILSEEEPDLASRRAAYAEAIRSLQDRLTELSGQAAGSDAAVPDLRNRLETVQIALNAARAEAATLDAQYEAWHARRFPTWTQTVAYTLGTDQLVRRTEITPELTLGAAELPPGKTAEIVARALGVVVVRVDRQRETDDSPIVDDAAIVYRLPSPIELAVYEAESVELDEDGGAVLPTTYRLRSVTPAWVVDSNSVHQALPLSSRLFGKDGTTIAFGESGTVKKISNSASATQLVDFAADAVGDVTTGLGDAAKIAKAFPPGADPAHAALEAKVAERELEARLVKANKTIAGAPQEKPEPAS